MREQGRLVPRSRTPGRVMLERRLRGALVAIQRYANHRATSPSDRQWAVAWIAALTRELNEHNEEHGRWN